METQANNVGQSVNKNTGSKDEKLQKVGFLEAGLAFVVFSAAWIFWIVIPRFSINTTDDNVLITAGLILIQLVIVAIIILSPFWIANALLRARLKTSQSFKGDLLGAGFIAFCGAIGISILIASVSSNFSVDQDGWGIVQAGFVFVFGTAYLAQIKLKPELKIENQVAKG